MTRNKISLKDISFNLSSLKYRSRFSRTVWMTCKPEQALMFNLCTALSITDFYSDLTSHNTNNWYYSQAFFVSFESLKTCSIMNYFHLKNILKSNLVHKSKLWICSCLLYKAEHRQRQRFSFSNQDLSRYTSLGASKYGAIYRASTTKILIKVFLCIFLQRRDKLP